MRDYETGKERPLDYDLAQNRKGPQRHKVKTWNTIEAMFLIIIILGFGLRYLHLPGAGVLILSGFTLLSALYFLFGFANLNGIPPAKIFTKNIYKKFQPAEFLVAIFGGWAISMALVGIMFKALYWEGSTFVLFSALGFLAGVAIFLLLWQPQKFLHKRLLTRCSLVGIMGLTQIVSVI